MPSGPGVIPDETIREVARATPPPTRTFLLTSRRDPAAIAAQYRALGTTTIQLVDRVGPVGLRRLRDLVPGAELVQVIHVTGTDSVAEASEVAPLVDALLLDSGRPRAPVPELGGTGRVHDWALSRAIRNDSPVPVYLAGGLTPDNVARAWQEVRPQGLDVCSGLRIDGALDAGLLQSFMSRVAELPA